MNEKMAREAAVRLLEEKGNRVTDISKGQGVPKFSRILMQKDTSTLSCVIKTSTGGRISFTRDTDGSYKVLRDAEYVIHVRPAVNDPTMVRVTMFDRKTVVQAFDANHVALVEHKMEHMPSWVNPDEEKGWRLTGSGFGRNALWSETVPLAPAAVDNTASATQANVADQPLKLTIAQAKQGLAENFGVAPDKIEIIVRG
ncbi:hypothetical protein [Mesorhizobium sp. M1403]|uniref:hypothetical protein n=1 Tax=Mesorhizobium sp. M1403 TaxID=2957097 RepID=UPI00333C5D3F